MARSPSDILLELGFGCTVNTTQCKDVLSHFLPLTETSVAQIMSATARTCSGLVDHQHVYSALPLVVGFVNPSDQLSMNSWNIDVLVDSIKQLVSFLLVIIKYNFFWTSGK